MAIINISEIEKYGKEHGKDNFSPKVNEMIEKNSEKISDNLSKKEEQEYFDYCDSKKGKIDNIKTIFENLDEEYLNDQNIITLNNIVDFYYHSWINQEASIEFEQYGTTFNIIYNNYNTKNSTENIFKETISIIKRSNDESNIKTQNLNNNNFYISFDSKTTTENILKNTSLYYADKIIPMLPEIIDNLDPANINPSPINYIEDFDWNK